MSYIDRLHTKIVEKGNPVVVGLDPRWGSLPAEFRSAGESAATPAPALRAAAYRAFCLRLLDVVAPLVPAVKPQVAFFEECGPDGMSALRDIIRQARKLGLIVIADAKRGDIGTTAEAYADAWLAGDDPDRAVWSADALTISPYLGEDTLEPFVRKAEERRAGLYVLVRTSNPGAGSFQDVGLPQGQVFHRVADVVTALSRRGRESAGSDASPSSSALLKSGLQYGSIGAVVGATYPGELAELRHRMPGVPFLIPGYGAQGGTSADVLPAFDAQGLGAVINSSRGIIFAWEREPYCTGYAPNQWEQAVEHATRDMLGDLQQALASR